MDQPVLSDKNQFPSPKIIFSHIGKARPLWLSLFEFIHTTYPDFVEEWRYYNDGKSWLMKVTRKKKTVFWLSVIEGAFRTTFYVGDKAEKIILDSKISDGLKDQFRNKTYGKIHGITIIHKTKKDLEQAKLLIDLKLGIK
jgi:hypothetical protein